MEIEFFLDNVYTRISDLENNAQMFGVDLVYDHACLSAYIQKYKRAKSVNLKIFLLVCSVFIK